MAIKIVSFIISILIVRNSSIADYGKIAVNYQLVVSLPLFLLKEGFRRSALRSEKHGPVIVLMGVIATVVGFIPLVLVGYYVLVNAESAPVLALIGVALAIEAVAEIPLLEQAVVQKNLTIRTSSEMIANLVRSVALLAVIVWLGDASTAFAVAQLLSAISFLALATRGLKVNALICEQPLRTLSATVRSKAVMVPLMEMVAMSVQKLFLAEGEKMLTIAFLSGEQIGQLGLTNNIGSIVLRLVFGPIEEIAFTALASSKQTSERKRVLQSVFLVQAAIGLFSVSFGPQVCEAAIFLLYGPDWALDSTVVTMLQFYCGLLLLFALNGALEAYYFAVANSKQVRSSLITQAVAFAGMIGTVWFTHPMGPISILLGNAVSMGIRIMAACRVFDRASDPIHPALGGILVAVVAGGVASRIALIGTAPYVTSLSVGRKAIAEIAVMGTVALVTLASIFRKLRSSLMDIKSDKRK